MDPSRAILPSIVSLITVAVGAPACGLLGLNGAERDHQSLDASAATPEDLGPCVSEPLRTARIDRSQPRDFGRAKTAFDRGLTLQERGEHAEALVAFKKAVGADPTFGLAHLEAALSHLYTDNAHDALLSHLSAAVVLMPRNPRAQLQYARLQRELGESRLAETHFDCAVQISPALAPAHESLARLLLTQGRVEEAEQRARAAVGLQPTETTYRVLLADILTRREQWNEAGKEVELAARQVGRSAALFRRAAQLFARAGAEQDAQRMRAMADEIDPPPAKRRLRPLRRRR